MMKTMPYVNLTKSTLHGLGLKRRVYCEISHFGDLPGPRVTRLTFIPISTLLIITGMMNGVIGIGTGCAVLATASSGPQILKFVVNHLGSSRHILSLPFFLFLKALNPLSALEGLAVEDLNLSLAIEERIERFEISSSFLKRHFSTRLGHVLVIITALIESVVHLALAPMAMNPFDSRTRTRC